MSDVADDVPKRIGLIRDELGVGLWALGTVEDAERAVHYIRADLHDIEIARLRAELAEAQQAEKDWIKVANNLTTHLEKAERQRDAARAEALEEAAKVADEIAHRHCQAGVDLRGGPDRMASQLASYTSRCIDDVAAAIRAIATQPVPISVREAARVLLAALEAPPTGSDDLEPWRRANEALGTGEEAWPRFRSALRALGETK